MKFLDALFNATKTEAVAAPRRIQADAIVGNRHVQPIVLAGDAHLDGPCRGVPDAIGERLLNRPIHACSISVRQGIEIAVHGELDVHAVAAGEVAHVPFKRRLQAEVVQHARPETKCEIPDRAKHLVHQLPAFRHDRTKPRVSRRPHPFDAAQFHPQCGENLRHMVVQLT